MSNITETIQSIGIVPVAVIDDAADAKAIANALILGNIPVIEVTMRTEAAVQAIRNISAMENILVGAGTVITKEQVDTAIDAGAKFVVSPCLDPEIVKYCQSKDIPICPGISTGSEIQQAVNLGLDFLKFFPAELNGGPKMLATFGSVFPNVKFMPTGGLNLENFKDYLGLPNVVGCGGSFMLPKSAIAAGKFEDITAVCKFIIKSLFNFKLLHVGVNCESEDAASKTAGDFSELFGMTVTDLGGALFCDDALEILKKPLYGEHGHIAFETDDLDRAIGYFERKGYTFRDEPVIKDEKGTVVVYFEKEIAGYAVHLRRSM